MFVELKKVFDEMEAQVLVSHLNEENIESIIEKDDAGGMYPQLQAARGVKVFVEENDLEKAKRVIEVKDNGDLDSWVCKKCNEVHEGQFVLCWNCGEKRS